MVTKAKWKLITKLLRVPYGCQNKNDVKPLHICSPNVKTLCCWYCKDLLSCFKHHQAGP